MIEYDSDTPDAEPFCSECGAILECDVVCSDGHTNGGTLTLRLWCPNNEGCPGEVGVMYAKSIDIASFSILS